MDSRHQVPVPSEETALLAGRRSLAWGPVIAAAAALFSFNWQAKAKQTHDIVSTRRIQIKAPKDGMIVEVPAKVGARLTEGDVLCVLDTKQEGHLIDRINAARQLIQLDQANMDATKIAVRKQILQQNATAAQALFTFAQDKATAYKQQAASMIASPLDAVQAVAAQARAQSEIDKANTSLALFDDNVIQTNARLQILAMQMDAELKYLQQQVSNASLKMPASGILSSLASKNSFVQKGDVVAEVT